MKPGRTLISKTQIRDRVQKLGKKISRYYKGKRPIFLGVMNGSVFFLPDLIRATYLDDVEISCISLASYVGTKTTGEITGLDKIGKGFKGRRVLVIDDILDTGRTLAALTARLKALGAAEVKTCVLLLKRGKQQVPFRADWVGFKIPDHFVIGYGLDYDGKYRGLKQVRALDR